MTGFLQIPLARTLFAFAILACLPLGSAHFIPLPTLDDDERLQDAIETEEELMMVESRSIQGVISAPLFHENRERAKPRPRNAPAPAPVPVQRTLSYSLSGVLGSGDSRTAYLLNTATGETVTARAGDQHADIEIVRVEADRVIVIFDGEEKEIALGG